MQPSLEVPEDHRRLHLLTPDGWRRRAEVARWAAQCFSQATLESLRSFGEDGFEAVNNLYTNLSPTATLEDIEAYASGIVAVFESNMMDDADEVVGGLDSTEAEATHSAASPEGASASEFTATDGLPHAGPAAEAASSGWGAPCGQASGTEATGAPHRFSPLNLPHGDGGTGGLLLSDPTYNRLTYHCPLCAARLELKIRSLNGQEDDTHLVHCDGCKALLGLRGNWSWLASPHLAGLPAGSSPPSLSVLSPPSIRMPAS